MVNEKPRRLEVEEYEAMLEDERYALLGEMRREDGDIIAHILDTETEEILRVITG